MQNVISDLLIDERISRSSQVDATYTTISNKSQNYFIFRHISYPQLIYKHNIYI